MDQTLFGESPDETGSVDGFLQHIPFILMQRKWWIIAPAVLGAVGAIAAVLLIPPVYRSNAVMLVQSAQLPADVIGDDRGEVVDRRIAAIQQQITARSDLIELIEQHQLYAAERRSGSLSKVVEQMRSAITLAPKQMNLLNDAAGKRTIAFELAFEYSDPVAAQAVAQDLMDRVLRLDARGNAEQATNVVQFLTDQAAGLAKQIAALQGEIAEVNARNGNVLAGSGMIVGGNTGSYDVQIAALQRDNQLLIQQRNAAQTSDSRDPIVSAAEQRLAAARAVYAESHPDVVIAKQGLEQARELAKSNTAKLPLDNLDQQIAFNNSQIAALRAAKSGEIAQVNSRLMAQSRAPLVQQQLSDLQQKLAALNEQYEQVQNKLLAARAGVRAEDEQMGERLSVVEPPVVPDAPSRPNRPLLAVMGIGGGLGLGVLLALAIELLLRPIRDPGVLKGLLGASPLGVVPVIEDKTKPDTPWWRRFLPRR